MFTKRVTISKSTSRPLFSRYLNHTSKCGWKCRIPHRSALPLYLWTLHGLRNLMPPLATPTNLHSQNWPNPCSYPTVGRGELIWAMTTCRPDLAYASVKLSQANTCPHELHFHGLKHALKYLSNSRDNGLYFWRTKPQMELQEGPIPTIKSNRQDILLENCPQFDATVAHAYADSDWATCIKTRW